MLRAYTMVTLALVVIGGLAIAADPVMGNWEGKFTAGDWKGDRVFAKVIAEGGDAYRLRLYVGPADDPWPKVYLAGRRIDKIAVFIGKADLGKAHGGAFVITAESFDRAMTGRFRGKGKKADFELKKMVVGSPTLGQRPPEGVVVLFDGTNLDAWNLRPGPLGEGVMQVVSASEFTSKQEFGDCQIHLEFRTPLMASDRGQGRANSGVYVQGRYEIQVLDSFGDDPADNLCGGIYKIATPLVDACLPPMAWQTYDITFYAPRLNEAGEKTKNAEITVLHNGVLIHDKVSIPRITPGGVSGEESKTGPLFFQNHGDRVCYRNVWVLPL